MLTLGIETSGRRGEIALCRDGECLEERILSKEGFRHAQSLISEVNRLFQDFQIQPTDCDVVAVSIGPGSFTGLRIGVVFAKTFAYATGCRLVGVDTFLSIAEGCPLEISDLHIVEDAQRNGLFVGRYFRDSNSQWIQKSEIKILDREKWCQSREAMDILTGPGVEKIEQQLNNQCRILDSEFRQSTATNIARLGTRQANRGDSDDLWSLEPFYLRKSAAEEKWDTEHQVGSMPIDR